MREDNSPIIMKGKLQVALRLK